MLTMETSTTAVPSLADDFVAIRVQPRYGYDDGFDWADWRRRMGLPTGVVPV